ncbi:MAG: metal ABC transporter solute-binding protein, Zn/Mn family [Francisellaceae bacterium]
MKKLIKFSLIIMTLLSSIPVFAAINVVAAENFYGNVAHLIGGDRVKVKSIIANPDADPHLFTTSAKTAVDIHDADVIIYNGADYDPWIKQLLSATTRDKPPIIIDVANLMDVKSGENPHIWYNPKTFPALAQKLSETFSSLDPKHATTFKRNLETFLNRFDAIDQLINQIRVKYKGTAVTATEPVFGWMANALGLDMKALKFQWLIMNDSEPTPRMMADFQNLIRQHKVDVLFYNQQVADPLTQNILLLAQKSHVAVVGISETMPAAENVITWMKQVLNQTEQALESSDGK